MQKLPEQILEFWAIKKSFALIPCSPPFWLKNFLSPFFELTASSVAFYCQLDAAPRKNKSGNDKKVIFMIHFNIGLSFETKKNSGIDVVTRNL